MIPPPLAAQSVTDCVASHDNTCQKRVTSHDITCHNSGLGRPRLVLIYVRAHFPRDLARRLLRHSYSEQDLYREEQLPRQPHSISHLKFLNLLTPIRPQCLMCQTPKSFWSLHSQKLHHDLGMSVQELQLIEVFTVCL